MKQQITTTKQLRGIFPYLPATNKFKRAIDKYMAASKTAIYLDGAEPWKCYVSKDNKKYKFKLGDGNTSFCMCKTRLESNWSVPKAQVEADPTAYRNVTDTDSYSVIDGKKVPYVQVEFEKTDYTSWSQIALILGKLMKDEFAHVEACSKCGGSGFIPAFAHIDNGVCYQCMGIGHSVHLNPEK